MKHAKQVEAQLMAEVGAGHEAAACREKAEGLRAKYGL
jgi:hypothetical protein